MSQEWNSESKDLQHWDSDCMSEAAGQQRELDNCRGRFKSKESCANY